MSEEVAVITPLSTISRRPIAATQPPLRSTNSTSNRPQDEGNYRVAHSKLLRAVRQLAALGCPPPRELAAALALLHSYVLVRSLIGLEDHLGAARMLVRVAGSISRCDSGVRGAGCLYSCVSG